MTMPKRAEFYWSTRTLRVDIRDEDYLESFDILYVDAQRNIAASGVFGPLIVRLLNAHFRAKDLLVD